MKKIINLILILTCFISGTFYIYQRNFKTVYTFNEDIAKVENIKIEDTKSDEDISKDDNIKTENTKSDKDISKDDNTKTEDTKNNENISSKTIDKTDLTEQNNNILININTADEESLKTLPQIGQTLARRIIEYRELNGGFKDISEIKNVDMIGDKIFEKIKNLITI